MAETSKRQPRKQKESFTVQVAVDLTRIAKDKFDPQRPLRIATVRDGQVIDDTVVTPAEQKNPRRFEVALDLGPAVDGVAGANVVVAPAEDKRNLLSQFVARKFVYGAEDRIDAGTLIVRPGIYDWWRFCWFPRKYRITGRVVRQEGDCTHPVGAANVEIYDVDYCWWWYDEDLITTATTDPDGFFEIEFTWCVPLWCVFRPLDPPPYIDVHLRDRLWELLRRRWPIPLPDPPIPPIPPDDPWTFNELLSDLNIRLPHGPQVTPRVEGPGMVRMRAVERADFTALAAATPGATIARAEQPALRANIEPPYALDWRDLFGDLVFWPVCDHPCDWRPDIRIRVTQNQPDAGTVEIYRDAFWDIRWNLDSDLLDLTLEANELALYADACRPDPLLGNCMLFERVGNFNVSTIYQPDLAPSLPGISYGTTPSASALLGRTVDRDRPWCLTFGVHGDFGKAAQVDYYQVQYARWTAGDITAWEADPGYTPPDVRYAALSPAYLPAFVRKYSELKTTPFPHYEWRSEVFGPQTVAGIPGLFKSRQRFELEYESAHGGPPAPDFVSGWYWDTSTMTQLFRVLSGGDDGDLAALTDGVYSFRLIGYTQTGTDSSGQPVLNPVNMGLPGGVLRRCSGDYAVTIPDLVTMLLVNNPHVPTCELKSLKRNGVDPVGECDILILGDTDSLSIEFEASDPKGNLDGYYVTIQRGSGAAHNIFSHMPPITIAGSPHIGPNYPAALGQGAVQPVWNGGTWTAVVPASFFAALGGSCAYDLELHAWDRHTNGYSAGIGWGSVHCKDDRAFTVILAGDREEYCAQLDCCADDEHPGGGPPNVPPGLNR